MIPEDIWEQLKSLSKKDDCDEVITFEITALTKEERTTIHQSIKRYFEKKIVANTVNKEDKKFIEFKKYNKSSKFITLVLTS